MDERCFENKKRCASILYTYILVLPTACPQKEGKIKKKGNETEIRMKRRTPRVLEE
jgi:hypothetical protein